MNATNTISGRVTTADISEARRRESNEDYKVCRDCVMGVAVERTTKRPVDVGYTGFTFRDDSTAFNFTKPSPPEISRLIEDFDRGIDPKEFDFEATYDESE